MKKEVDMNNIDSYESACEYLGRENDSLECGCDNRHYKAMVAMFKLVTIAEAWNREDDFVPDFSNKNQEKYYPWFLFDANDERFVLAYPYSPASFSGAGFGSRLCLKTELRAKKFGEQFIDLWNDFFLFK